MATTYLEIDFREVKFYHFSKTAKEDYTEIKEGVHKKFFNKGVFGILQSVREIDSKFGKKISISIKNSEGYFALGIPIYSQNGGIDNRFAEPLICTLPNLKKGSTYRFFPWRMEDDESGRNFHGFSIKLANLDTEEVTDKVERAYVRPKQDEKKKPNHLPKLDFRERNGVNRPTAASLEALQFFIEDLLTEQCERLKSDYNANSNSNATTNATETATAKAPSQEVPNATASEAFPPLSDVEDDNDLPF